MDIHLIEGENVTFESVRAESRREAISTALDQLPDTHAPDWDTARVIHAEGEVYVVRVSRAKPDGW
jgi:hypothetical protein